jgi:CBS domain-containing protein
MKVKDFIREASERLATVTPELGIREVAEKLAEPGIDLVVVTDGDGKMVGVVTDTDIVTWVAGNEPGGSGAVTAETLMSTNVFSCTAEQAFGAVVDNAVKRGHKHFPVLDENGQPIGVVYVSDALIALHKQDLLSPEAVMAYIHRRGYL